MNLNLIMNYQKQWEFLKNKFGANNLAHGYIFAGHDIASIKQFTKELVALVHCFPPKADPPLAEKPTSMQYPDLLTVNSLQSDSSVKNEKDMMEIDVDQIRAVQIFLSYKSYYGGYKVVVIENAERMNTEAQSCFLKSLEEPKGKTLIILLSGKPEFLLPTISSRCQIVKFLGESSAMPELPKELQDVIGLDLAEKFKYAKSANLEGENFSNILNGLQRYFRNLLLVKIGIGDTNLRMHPSAPNTNYTIDKLKKIIRLVETLNYQATTSNANTKLALEVLMLEL